MPRVLNKKTDKIPPGAVYVGRPSKWGNPYKITAVSGTPMERRMWAIGHYNLYINQEIAAGHLDIKELAGKDLVCWCSPLPCHADILLELANREK